MDPGASGPRSKISEEVFGGMQGPNIELLKTSIFNAAPWIQDGLRKKFLWNLGSWIQGPKIEIF